MRIASFLIALGVLALSSTDMSAQTCFGDAPFSAGPVRLGAGLTSSDGAKSYGVDLAVGANAGPFAEGGVSRTKYSDVDVTGTSFGLTGGYAIDLNRARTVQLCPYVDVSHESVPDIDVGLSMLKTSIETVGVGASVGETMRVRPNLDLVPFVGATYGISRDWFTLDGTTDSVSQRFGVIDLGAGFVIRKEFTIQPQISIPVGIEGAKSAFALAFAFNVGS